MLKQAGLDHLATTDDRARLLVAIQSSSQSGGQQQLSLQVTCQQHLCCSVCLRCHLDGTDFLTALQALAAIGLYPFIHLGCAHGILHAVLQGSICSFSLG